MCQTAIQPLPFTKEIIKMKRNRATFCLAIVCLFLTITTIKSEAGEGLGLTVKGGTLGGGVEISASLLENTRLRGGINYMPGYSFDTDISDINYDFETDFSSISLLLDWHPFSGTFFLSGGALINNNSISATGTIDEGMVPSEFSAYSSYVDLISVSGDVEFATFAPYLGIGWRTNNGESGWGFACELGVLFQGSPEVKKLRVNAPVDVNSNEAVQQFLNEQRAEIEDELEPFRYYPVGSLMLTYNF